jgi:hypothetical protein
VRHDVQEKFAATETSRRGEIGIDRGSGNRRQIDMHATTGPENIDHDEADHQRERRHHLEINQCLDGDPPNAPGLPHRGDAVHHGTEDDEAVEYGDQADE